MCRCSMESFYYIDNNNLILCYIEKTFNKDKRYNSYHMNTYIDRSKTWTKIRLTCDITRLRCDDTSLPSPERTILSEEATGSISSKSTHLIPEIFSSPSTSSFFNSRRLMHRRRSQSLTLAATQKPPPGWHDA